jgi:hypothetical protein
VQVRVLRQRVDHGDDAGQGLHLDRGYDSAKTRDLLAGLPKIMSTRGSESCS